MSSTRTPKPIRIGLLADEPIRLAGLVSVFDLPAGEFHARLAPVVGTTAELLAQETIAYLVVDLHSSSNGLKALEQIRRARPDIRLIVIGPEGDEDLVIKSISAGARAYLDLKAGPDIVRKALDVVTEGSIWAPRRLLSKLIDRLIKTSDVKLTAALPRQLTARERQVLDLILLARSNREIAEELGIEERTVRAHLGRLMRKAGVDNRIKLSISARSLFQLPHKPIARVESAENSHLALTK